MSESNSSTFIPPLTPGQVISNRELMNIFHCACEGGIRPARATNSITLVLNHTKHDHAKDWHGDILDFRGTGSKEQSLDKGHNKTLLNSLKAHKVAWLFEVYKSGEYTFRGPVTLAGAPFSRQEPNASGQNRTVWIFPLRLEPMPTNKA